MGTKTMQGSSDSLKIGGGLLGSRVCFTSCYAALRFGRGWVKAIHVQTGQRPVDAVELSFHDFSNLLRRAKSSQVQ